MPPSVTNKYIHDRAAWKAGEGGGKEALVEPKVPNGSFQTFNKDMT